MIEQRSDAPPRQLPTADDVDLANVSVSYDRDSDMLLIHFTDRGRAGVVDYVSSVLATLVDVETEEVVGFQVEDFLGKVVASNPRHLDLLEVAELRGITPHEVAALRGAAPIDDRRRSAVASLLDDLATFPQPIGAEASS